MFSSILILLAMPFTDLGRNRGIQFRPLSKIAFYIFLGNFFILMELGAKHVEPPFIEFGQVSTAIYFSYFLIVVPFLSLLENSLIELIGEESLDEDVSYNNIALQRSPVTSGIAGVAGSAAVVNGITAGNVTESDRDENSREESAINPSQNASNSPDIGSGDLEKERKIYQILNDCHSEVQDADGDPAGTVQTMMEQILVKQHEIVQAIVEMTSSGS